MGDLERRIRQLPPEQLGRLLHDLQQDRAAASPEGIAPRSTDGPPPLSFSQQRLWFLHQLEPESAAYHAVDAIRLSGSLDVDALGKSLDAIVARHEVLRTTFDLRDGEPVQIIAPRGAWPLERESLRKLPSAQRGEAAAARAREEQRRAFDLRSGPLARARLLEVDDNEHVLLLNLHHIVADEWAIRLLRKELSVLYRAYREGRTPDLPPLPIQYADFAAWQRNRLKGEVLDKQLDFWRRKLRAMGELKLPTDRPRPPRPSDRSGAAWLELPGSLVDELRHTAQTHQCTMFMALLAAFQVLLARATGQDDIVVGTPVSNRGHREVENLVGFFVNTLVMRIQLDGDPSFRDVLDRVRAMALEAYANQDLPFERLVEEARPERNPSRNPLFQVMFAVHHFPTEEFALGELAHSALDLGPYASRFDLDFNLWLHPGGLRVGAFYASDLFDGATIQQLVERFGNVLRAVASRPELRVSEVPFLLPRERDQLLVDWNRASEARDAEMCLHEWFEMQVDRSPDAVALACDGNELSYRALDERANELAARLGSLGVSRETPVALYLPPSETTVVAILAVLKAGGAYVAMDVDTPPQRLVLIAGETKPPVLLTLESLVGRLPALPGVRVVCVDGLQVSQAVKLDQKSRKRRALPDQLAYIMYTSGSTGRPKGVAVTHRNVVRLMKTTRAWFDFGPDDVWTMFHSYGFDFSVWEMWGALLHGGRLVVVPWLVSRSPREFCRLLRQQQVTVMCQTPTAFNQLLQEQDFLESPPPALRWIIFGGERLQMRELAGWFARRDDARPRLANMFGITETTVHATFQPLTADEYIAADGDAPSLIGKRLDDLQLYLLDPRGQPVSFGAPGEIYLGGPGLARGYWRDPALTAARFGPHPFAQRPGDRLYRTGDRARFRRDGTLEYLGRCDDQVKIRGVRIEPAEVEAALCRIPAVRQAVVRALDGAGGQKRLVAYVVPRVETVVTADQLRQALGDELPPASIPSSFVFLDVLPLTAQGKVCRSALPADEAVRPVLEAEFESPRTPIEMAVAEIWRGVLGLDRVGAMDNFFDLGGHSLKAAQVIARLRDTLQIDLSLQTLFSRPTLREFAVAVERAIAPERASSTGPQCVRRLKKPQLSFAQQRLVFLEQMQRESGAYHIPLVMDLRGPLNVAALCAGLDAIEERHEALRTSFPSDQGQPYQRIAPPRGIALESLDLAGRTAAARREELRRRAIWEQQAPFDLEGGPLVRACLARLAGEHHVLYLTMHHTISDGWSIGVLRRELAECYRAFCAGRQPRLAPLSVQYADYSQWQRDNTSGEMLQRQLSYWWRRLAGLSVLRLPTDFPRPSTASARGAVEYAALPTDLSQRLAALNRRQGVTLFMTLLAAFKVLIYRYTGQTDIAVGSPIANRSHTEIESLIGCFVNTLVLRTDISGDPAFDELLRRVRDTALEAYAHQEIPFEQLVEDLQPERHAGQNPLFEIMFALQNAPLEPLELAGLTISSPPHEVTTTRFDLQWDVIEHQGGMQMVVYYRSELFEPATIRRMLGHYQTLLERIVAEPSRRLSALAMLADGQRQELAGFGRGPQNPFPADLCVHELFQQQARRTPDAVAVECDARRETYIQLDHKARQIAAALGRRGVGAEVAVGICIEPSADLVAAMLGVLLAGGAYVPLDPNLPDQRLRALISSASVKTIVSQRESTERLGRLCQLDTCLLEDLSRQSGQSAPLPAVNPGNLAYVMHTSGSTGAAKAVGIPHRAIVRLVRNTDYVELSESDVVAQAANPAFDAATFEIWGALLNGARLVIVPRETCLAPDSLARFLRERQVTTLWLTASLFNELVRCRPDCFATLRYLLFGGEAADLASVRLALSGGAPAHLLNMYGPTECTTFATSYHIRAVPEPARSVPIGRPIANTRIWLLDDDLQVVPIGVPGEIHIAGPGLARGYVSDPPLTAERFIPNPFDEPGSRLYKTGDLARYQADGTLAFLGRRDDQVKIRGFRVELGEIQTVIRDHPAVRQCFVLARADQPGEGRLVAYVAADLRAREEAERGRSLGQWQRFYDDLYRDSSSATDNRFNIVGWVSSYTGQPLPEAAMREQVEQTVERIVSHRPRRVLEIGCGTGLLLFRIAPGGEAYWGTDLSPVVLTSLRQCLERERAGRGITLWQRGADDFSDLPSHGVDAVVLNSVVQYFPDRAYLTRVLEQAADVISDGGICFVGDVRSLSLWEPFQTAVELFHAPDSLSAGELRRRVARKMNQEPELLVDPRFFVELAERLPGMVGVEITPKRGRHQNELVQCRYDVVFRFGGRRPGGAASDAVAWQDAWDAAAIGRHLEQDRPDRFALGAVANARVALLVELAAHVRQHEGTIGPLRRKLIKPRRQQPGVDPEDLWSLGEKLGYEVRIDWSRGDSSGCFDVVFTKRGLTIPELPATKPGYAAPAAASVYTNAPLRGRVERALAQDLRQYVRKSLPDYMVPSAFVILEELPLTRHGKLDRRRIPPPGSWTIAEAGSDQRPQTPTEQTIAGVLAEVLRVPQVGLCDNFFDLGGHSLLGMQVVTRLRDLFGVNVPLRKLFEAPTVAELAVAITLLKSCQLDEDHLRAQLDEVETLPASEIEKRLLAAEDARHERS